ncbi:hypothetical protein GX586_14410, partial [bacterium]|nr:hypothetical protein [bacterium]
KAESGGYNLLYHASTLDGAFTKPLRVPANVKFEYGIMSSANFSTLTFPPVYSDKSINYTKIEFAHYCNQERLWDRDEDKRKRDRYMSHQGNPNPLRPLYVTVRFDMREDVGSWQYDIRRTFDVGASPDKAVEVDFTTPPKLEVVIVDSAFSQMKKGVVVLLNYGGSRSSSTGDGYIDNLITCKKGGSEPEVEIVIKKKDGTVFATDREKFSDVGYRSRSVIEAARERKTEQAKYIARMPTEGGTVEVSLDLGPMFGVLTASADCAPL